MEVFFPLGGSFLLKKIECVPMPIANWKPVVRKTQEILE
jgi:hypothetical protein